MAAGVAAQGDGDDPPGAGEAPAASGATVEIEQLEQLIGTLEDPAAREVFIARLRTLVEAAEASAPATPPRDLETIGLAAATELGERVTSFAQSIAALARTIVDLPELGRWSVEQVRDPALRAYWLEMVGQIGAAMVLGLLARLGARHQLKGPRRGLGEAPRDAPTAERLRRLLRRCLLDVVPVIAFAVVSYAALQLARPEPATEMVALTLIKATLAVLLILMVARLALAPRTPALRLLPIDDDRAAYFLRTIHRFGLVVVYSYAFFESDLLLRIPEGIAAGLERAIGFVVTVMVVVFIIDNRGPVAAWVRGGEPAEGRLGGPVAALRRSLATIWPFVAVAYVLGTYFVWALNLPGGFTAMLWNAVFTVFLLGMAQPLAHVVEGLIGRGISLGRMELSYPRLRPRIERYFAAMQRISDGAVYLLVALAIAQVWGIELVILADAALTDGVKRALGWIGTVALVLLILWELSGLVIENYLEQLDETGAPVERTGRARTLLPLLRTAVLAIVTLVLLLGPMSRLGVDLAPLLATAGVIGIAIGFGSQKLVQDLINGLFILFQDTVAVGDVVEVAGHTGAVEGISVRAISLRDIEGVVHTIPFSEVTTVKNWGKDFAYALLDVGVAYREDVDAVIEVLRQVGAELEADARFGQFVLEPIDVWGLETFAESALVIRARIKTKPLKQWYIRREFNRRLKQRFDQLGIEIPFPHQTVYFGHDKPAATGSAPDAGLAEARWVGDEARSAPQELRAVGGRVAGDERRS